MNKLNGSNIKLAIQKDGRLTVETVNFLRSSGLEFEAYKQRLFSTCRNFPLEILYVRDDDIPGYVEGGVVDIGIVGQNLLYEKRIKIKKLLNLRFGFCSLSIAVLKESSVQTIQDLVGKKIATSYPKSTKVYFQKQNIPIDIVQISGAVEIAPALGIASAIVDLISTGSTLALNDLRTIGTIFESEGVLISNSSSFQSTKSIFIKQLLMRFRAVLSAKNYKYIIMRAPDSVLSKIHKVVPGLKSSTISPLAKKGWISIQSVIKEDIFWQSIEKFKRLGALDILVLPVEKLIV